MTYEEIKEKNLRLYTLKKEVDTAASLEECIHNLTNEGLIELYNLYDITEDNNLKKSKPAKMNYLIREIPGQFLDDFRFMMDKEAKETIVKLCQNKQTEINKSILHFMSFGFVFRTPCGKLIFPQELEWFITDYLCSLKHRKNSLKWMC